MHWLHICLITLTASLATSATAEVIKEVPSAISEFNQTCLNGGVDALTRPVTLKTTGWVESTSVTIDVSKLNISKSIDRNYDFSNPEKITEWTKALDGRLFKMILASFHAKRRYPNLCALIVDDVSNAMPYADELKDAFKAFGIGGKSVDLAHYFEFSGKLGADKHPARGEIFTRSFASGAKKSMHIYVAY